jgi:hypothetical protein
LRTCSRLLQVLPLAALLALAPRALAQLDIGKGDLPKLSLRVLLSDFEPLRDRADRNAELFYAAVRGEWTRKTFGARVELRGDEGRFRPYYPGDVWLEEGYAFVTTPVGELRVGKLERETFLPDDTFGGNLLSLNGLTRNPDFGAGLSGSRRFGFDKLAWTLAFFGQNDHVAWEKEGLGVESDPHAKLREDLEARVSYTVNKGLTTFTPGVSFATARIVRDTGPDVRRNDAGLDFTATLGPLAASVGLFSFRAEFPTVTYRYTYTEWRYRGADANERLHQPAVVWMPVKGIEATIEYEARRVRSPSGARVFNAVRLGLALSL